MMKAMHSGGGAFPTTDWGLFVDIRGGRPAAKLAALDILARRYWKPVFRFLQFSGKDEESAKDLTQAFFAEWIESNAFAKADEQKGRFRSFMLASLKRFAANEHRADQAQKRRPAAGLLSLDELMDDPEIAFEPADVRTPDMAFDRAWASEVVGRVLKHLEMECRNKAQYAHFDIFFRRLIQPILHGMEAPSMAELGQKHGLTERQSGNLLETAKRTFRRLLDEEVRLYAASDSEVTEEVRELFAILSQ
jgi:RNA polymerase sigma-70 factor (ECF subfamily)